MKNHGISTKIFVVVPDTKCRCVGCSYLHPEPPCCNKHRVDDDSYHGGCPCLSPTSGVRGVVSLRYCIALVEPGSEVRISNVLLVSFFSKTSSFDS